MAHFSKERYFKLLAVLLALFVCSMLMEILLRVFRPRVTYSKLLSLLKAGEYVAYDFIPFTLKPNNVRRVNSMEFPGKQVTVSVNSLSLRGKEINIQKNEGTKRILVLGDSYTFGVFVGDEETYPAVLEKSLNENGKEVEVINAGYADGWGPAEHYTWLMNRGLQFQPDVIVYGFFIGNDLEIKGEQWLQKDSRGLPAKIVDPDIYVDENGFIRSKIEDNKTVGYDLIYRIPFLRESHFLIFLSERIKKIFPPKVRDKNNKGWGEKPFPFILQEADNEKMQSQQYLFKKLLKGIADVAQTNNAKFLLLMIPINFQVDEKFLPKVIGSTEFSIKRNYFDEIKPWLKENKIEYLDLLEKMKANPGRYYPENAEVHFNPRGHEFTARQLQLQLKKLSWF